MEYVSATYDDEELAWVTPKITLDRDIYLMVTLKEKGKLVIRQDYGDGEVPKVPIKRHKDTECFELRVRVVPSKIDIQIFTSTEPKEIRYAYIQTRREAGHKGCPHQDR